MKLRWSNGRDYADSFEAIDEETFIANGGAALRVFRLATGRRVHRGEFHKNEYWADHPQLHVNIDGRWFSPGHIDTTGQWQVFKPFQVIFRHNQADGIEHLHALDAVQLRLSAANWWRGVYDCYRWSGALDAMIMDVGDMLDNAGQPPPPPNNIWGNDDDAPEA